MHFDSIHRGKMKQILLAYDLSKETVTAIMILYKNTWWRDRLLQHCHWCLTRRYISTIFVYTLPWLRASDADRSNKRKWHNAKKKAKNRLYHAKTITDADYANDLALLANARAQAESLLHSLEQTARGTGLHMNANKTEYIYFKRERAISTLSDGPLKFVDKFTYLSSNISSTEIDINKRLSIYAAILV